MKRWLAAIIVASSASLRCTVQFSLMRPDDSIGDSIIVTQED